MIISSMGLHSEQHYVDYWPLEMLPCILVEMY
jgi:hypothetical protein